MRAVKIIIAALAGFVAPFFLAGFVAWDMNMANWSWDGRAAAALLGFAFSALAALLAAESVS